MRQMSEKQAAFIERLIAQKQADIEITGDETAAEASEIIEKLMAMTDAGKTAVIEGQQQITGRVVKTDVKFLYYPSGGVASARAVMTVADDRGFLVWGTQAASIADEVRAGDRVTFTATVEKSDRDESFGFFKRPKSAEIIEQA